MHTFHIDKTEDFKCNISVEGIKLSDTKARLVLEQDDFNIFFMGTINSNGSCQIPIRKLGKLLQEGSSGKVRLEIIADNTLYSPWSDTYETVMSKKVYAEVKSVTENKPQVQVEVFKTNPVEEIVKLLQENKINKSNLQSNRSLVNKLLTTYLKRNTIEGDKKGIVVEALKSLKN